MGKMKKSLKKGQVMHAKSEKEVYLISCVHHACQTVWRFCNVMSRQFISMVQTANYFAFEFNFYFICHVNILKQFGMPLEKTGFIIFGGKDI